MASVCHSPPNNDPAKQLAAPNNIPKPSADNDATTPLSAASSMIVNLPSELVIRRPNVYKRTKRDPEDDVRLEFTVENALVELTKMVQSLMVENKELKKDLMDVKEMLKKVVGVCPASVQPVPLSYASVAKSNNKVVVINPTNKDVGSDVTRQAIKEKLKPSNYQVSGVSNSRNGGIIVQCSTSAERNKLKNDAVTELGSNFVVSVPEKKLPRIRIYGFTNELNATNLMEILREQNPSVFTSESVIKVEHIYFVKSKARYGAKLEVDALTFKKAVELGKAFVVWDSCWINEELNIRRCFKCWRFNHVASKCLEQNQTCPKCGGAHHTSDCVSTIFKCVVCCDAKKNRHLAVDTNHSALSSSCPSYLHLVELEHRKTDYSI